MSSISTARIFVITLALASLLSGSAKAGLNIWTSNGPLGENISALAIDPITPSTLYAGAHAAGVFKSTNSGASRIAINNGLTHPSHVWALAIDPITPSIIYAGTMGGGVFERMQVGFIFADGFEWGDTFAWFSTVP